MLLQEKEISSSACLLVRWGENREWDTRDVNFLRVSVVKNCLVKNCETMMFLICQHC